MKLELINIVCPACGNGNYMRHLIGKNVGHLDIKCLNCNSYFNSDELYKRREVLKQKPTNGDRLRAKSDEELAEFLSKTQKIGGDTEEHREGFYLLWLDWLREEVDDG